MSEFVKVASMDEIEEGEMKIFSVNEEDIVLANVDGKFHAFTNVCAHAGGPLGEGVLGGTVVTCPLHFAQFDITNGKVLALPAEKDIKTYEVKIEGKDILVKL